MPFQSRDDLKKCAALVETLPEPVILVGGDRRILAANPPARDIFGATMVGGSVLTYFRQPEAAAAIERGFEALQLGRAPETQIEASLTRSSPSRETMLRMTVTPMLNDEDVSALVVTLRDISHIEDAEAQRRDFVANVSHEMRSPLTVLAGFIETLKGPAREDPEARDNFLEIMEREAQRMTRLVSDLLSLSRVESEERVRPRAQVSMSEVLRATLAALRPQIEDMGISVDFRDLPDAPQIPGDRDQLVQVFHNLVENAMKYGGAGGRIEIGIDQVPAPPGMASEGLRVSVRDFGDGFDPLHIPRLTERFYRVDGHRSRAMGGTGLGLAIVKHIVNRHRGRLSIRSAPGEGSTFAVTLPIR